MARMLADNAWLRELIRLAWAEDVPQPPGAADLTVDSITDLHLEALYAFFLHDVTAEEAGNILSGAAPPFRAKEVEEAKSEAASKSRAAAAAAVLHKHLRVVAGIRKAESKRLTLVKRKASSSGKTQLEDEAVARRAFLLVVLMSWARSAGDVSIPHVHWERPDADEVARLQAQAADAAAADKMPDSAPPARGLRCAELPALMDTALIEVGFLFAAYRAECWCEAAASAPCDATALLSRV